MPARQTSGADSIRRTINLILRGSLQAGATPTDNIGNSAQPRRVYRRPIHAHCFDELPAGAAVRSCLAVADEHPNFRLAVIQLGTRPVPLALCQVVDRMVLTVHDYILFDSTYRVGYSASLSV